MSLISEPACMQRFSALERTVCAAAHQVGAYEPDAAIDVKADPAGRHHGLGVRHVKRRHVADGKAVPRVHVWEGYGPLRALHCHVRKLAA